MPTATYIPLQTITLSGSASTVTFGSIPNTYKDLVVIFSGDGPNSGSNEVFGRFNGDTGSNYFRIYAGGNGSSTYSAANSNQTAMGIMAPANGRIVNFVMNVMDYSATDKHKTSLVRDNDAGFQVVMRGFRWANTSAVTSLSIFLGSGNFYSGTTVSLFGIAG